MAATAHVLKSEMSYDKMDPVTTTIPLSPTASSHGGQLPQGFDDLVHHNNGATSFPRERAGIEGASIHSASEHPDSRMTTPGPHAAMSPHYAEYGVPSQQQRPVYANDYTYQSQLLYDAHDGAYPSMPGDVSPPIATLISRPS